MFAFVPPARCYKVVVTMEYENDQHVLIKPLGLLVEGNLNDMHVNVYVNI